MNARRALAWAAAAYGLAAAWKWADDHFEATTARLDELVTATHEARAIRSRAPSAVPVGRPLRPDDIPGPLRVVPDPSDGRVRLLVLGPGPGDVAQIFADGGRKVIAKAIDQWQAVRAIACHVHGINVDQLEQKALDRPGRRGRVKAVHQLPEGEIRSLVRDTMRLLTASPTKGGAR